MKGIIIMNVTDRTDEKKVRRSGYRFNVLDALIAVIILAVVALTLFAYLPSGLSHFSSTKNDATISYTIEIKGVRRELIEGIAVNDPVTEKGSAVALGKVSAEVEVSPASRVRYDAASGEVVVDELSDVSDILITVTSAAGYDKSRGYTVGGHRIAVGAEYTLSLPGFEGTGTCISINEISSGGGAK